MINLRNTKRPRGTIAAMVNTVAYFVIFYGLTTADRATAAEIVDPFLALPYEDFANTRFCTTYLTPTSLHVNLSPKDYCGVDSPCPDGMSCHYHSDCHIHDLIHEFDRQNKNDDKEMIIHQTVSLETLDADDPLRFNACGTSYTDADEKCGQWCLGEGSECPPGQGCFGFISCYFNNENKDNSRKKTLRHLRVKISNK